MKLSRILGVLKWLPPIWLTVAIWLYWGLPMLRNLGIPLFLGSFERNVLIQHGDTVMVVLLYGLALLNRWQPKSGRLLIRWRWHFLAWGFLVIGVFSTFVNSTPLSGALASLASLGRLGLYWAALSMLPWRAIHIEKMSKFIKRLSVINLIFVFVQAALYILTLRKATIPGDLGIGIMGFANDAVLMNLVWMGGILASSRGSSLKKRLRAAVWGVGGLLPAYLTGTAVFVFSLPLLWWFTADNKKKLSTRWVRAVSGVVIAIVIFGLSIWAYTTVYSVESQSYWRKIQTSYTPGFVSGLGIIAGYFVEHPLNAILGIGPGVVNSRPALRLSSVPRIPGLVLAFPYLVGGTTEPLTIFQMNQSYLVALAETGILGLLFLSGFWMMLMFATVKAVRGLGIPDYREYYFRCLSSVICLCLLGITSIYWNESPFGYWTLLSLAPLIFTSNAIEKVA